MPKFRIRSHIAAAAMLACTTSILPSFASDTPDAIAARGETLVATVQAAGVQIYECKAEAGGKLAWQFREPVATLFTEGRTVGRHYAGPHWEMTDGSIVSARVLARAPGAGANDIPLLKLEVTTWKGTGQLAGVTTIQRINTNGGVASGTCDAAGDILSVPYSADYAFFRKGAATAGAPATVVSRVAPAASPAYVASPAFVAPRPSIGVIIVRGNDRDRRPRKKKDEPKSPTAEPKSPPSQPTAEPKSPPATPAPEKVVRDHRSKPIVRDHRTTPQVRDHRAKPEIRDHRDSATASNSGQPAPRPTKSPLPTP
jgi:hypothetical protein